MLPIAAEASGLAPLGNDGLVFLAATVAIVPLCKFLRISSVLGFLAGGFLLGPSGLGVFNDLTDLDTLSEIGILFLLFEQGLELTLQRLKALAKFAFGLGALQVTLCTLAFGIFPFIGGVNFLEVFFHSRPDLVTITRLDEALIIGAALSLSSSAFVLKVLQEQGLKGGRTGAAALGVLLLQDVAVVPLLVLIPVVESQLNGGGVALSAADLVRTSLTSLGGLGALLLGGSLVLRRVFGAIATVRGEEAFVALSLLVALGMGEITAKLGLSSTLGAFCAGALLAETNYRAQVEANIQPFRGLMLGLFFMTTGASVDPLAVSQELPTFLALLLGLVAFKAAITSALAASPPFGLTPQEAARVGFLLAGGGEFSFVVFTLAERLEVLPSPLAKLLTAVVVASMALTPALDLAGARAGALLAGLPGAEDPLDLPPEALPLEGAGDPVVLCGFGPVGQTVGSLLASPELREEVEGGVAFVAFDKDPVRVAEARRRGAPVVYGDGSKREMLERCGVFEPKGFVVLHNAFEERLSAVVLLREEFPEAPIFSRASRLGQQMQLRRAGATCVVPERDELSIRLGATVVEALFGCGASDTLERAKRRLRAEIAERAERATADMADAEAAEAEAATVTAEVFSPYLGLGEEGVGEGLGEGVGEGEGGGVGG